MKSAKDAKKSGRKSPLSKHQRFEVETVKRSTLKNAPYNPRYISEGAQKRLKKAIREHGLVEPPVWNRRTGNLVGGHQRLAVLDSLERGNNYELQVAVIDVDEGEEQRINVQLNNPSMQGEWDLDKLAAMKTELDVPFEDMGFTESDVDFMFEGNEQFSAMFEEATEEVNEAKDAIRDVKEARAQGAEKMKEDLKAGFYFIVVCEDETEKKALMARLGMPVYEQYIDADRITQKLKPPKL